MKLFFALLFTCLWISCHAEKAPAIQHYVFFNMDRERIHEPGFIDNPVFAGAQLKYTWRELESEPDHYDFSAIQKDLKFLQSKHKRLFIQLQDTSFGNGKPLVPNYLLKDPQYHGGADKQYEMEGDDEATAKADGWVARRWDTAIRQRFHKLLFALGKEFDGKIEGINLPETAVDFGTSGKLYPQGFTPVIYRDAVLENMTALRKAFPKSVVMQYANFMPGEWLPKDNKGYLDSVYAHAKRIKSGVGGPDLIPFKPGQMNHAYPRIRSHSGIAPTGIAVQEGNYSQTNPKTGKPFTIAEIVDFAKNYLKVKYLFWCTEEPYFSQKLLPFLRASH